MGRNKRIWLLSPILAAKVQASLCIRAVSPEPPLLAWMAGHAQLEFVMTECSETQIRLTRHKCFILHVLLITNPCDDNEMSNGMMG